MPSDDVRRRPVQARSRTRFDQVLAAAATLIEARGVGPLTMTDIAEEAEMSLPAVYRYFPNKHAVLRELSLQTFAYDAETLLAGEVPPDATAVEIVAAGIEEYWHRHRVEPFRLQLRAAIRADAELSALDLAESRRNAATIAATVARATGRTDIAVMERQALLVVELADSLVSLASRVPLDEADALIREFVNMTACGLASPVQPRPSSPKARSARMTG